MEAPDFDISGYFGTGDGQFSSEKRISDQKTGGDHFTVEDLLDFSNEDDNMTDAFFDPITGKSTGSSSVTVVDSCNSSISGNETNFAQNVGCRNFSDHHFSGELCVPYDDLAELEWLSNFVEESFSTEDLQNLHILSGTKQPLPNSSTQPNLPNHHRIPTPSFHPNLSTVPAKAQRSKRSRAAPCDWSSRLLLLSPSPTPTSSSSSSDTKPSSYRKKEINNQNDNVEGRKCLHCASEKTPQWRTGPMGPKTLCNACGVRYKSGRLVPEYRPAASPTFVSTKHSNSHRKVVELRRQKEVQQTHQPFIGGGPVFGISDGGDYLIHHRTGLDYRHMI